jgi:hypothetical protein
MDRKHEEPRQVMSLTGLLFAALPSRSEFHRFIHRFTHDFLRVQSIQHWTQRIAGVLLFCASKPERELKHGTPATSVAGVYFYVPRFAPPP